LGFSLASFFTRVLILFFEGAHFAVVPPVEVVTHEGERSAHDYDEYDEINGVAAHCFMLFESK